MTSRPEGTIAVNQAVARFVDTRRQVIDIAATDFTDVSAVVLATEALKLAAVNCGVSAVYASAV